MMSFNNAAHLLLEGFKDAVCGAVEVRPSLVASIARDRAYAMKCMGATPDPWQLDLLTSTVAQTHVLCGRQMGKSLSAALLALNTAILTPRSTTLIVSRALRQSAELLRKTKELYRALNQHKKISPFQPVPLKSWYKQNPWYEQDGGPDEVSVVQESVLSMEFANGSRIISLPGKPDTIVGYSAITLLIIDEAARTSDDLYYYLRPMLAVSRGRLVALSTPKGKRGWFYKVHTDCEEAQKKGEPEPWKRIRVRGADCPRFDRNFLEMELREMGKRWYSQEYDLAFADLTGNVFDPEDVAALIDSEVKPLW
jgi:hypothetical protein